MGRTVSSPRSQACQRRSTCPWQPLTAVFVGTVRGYAGMTLT
jgi:hypothetical protein